MPSNCPRCHTPLPEDFRFCPTCGTDTSGAVDDSATKVLPDYQLQQNLRRVVGARYEIHGLLGRGGMGAVFKATDRKLERLVAIKVLPPEYATNKQVRERFLREARSAAKLDHPNIVPIYAVEDEKELYYFVMKYVGGKPLDEVLENQSLPWQEVQRILYEAGEALAHAHRRGIVHRDVKPANIMIDEDGRALLTDFGISKAQDTTSSFTATGAIVGTPAYLSPEQAKAEDVDGRSDQYSLGMVGYRMLAGEPAFKSATAHTLVYQHIFVDPPPLGERAPDGTPQFIVAAIHRALEKEPAARYDTIDGFVRAVFPEAMQSGSGFSSGATRLAASTPVARLAPRLMAASPADTVTKLKWTGVLGAVFVVNFLQTSFEACCQSTGMEALGFKVAAALHRIERGFLFLNHDMTNELAVRGYSISYFFLLPILALMVAYFAWQHSTRAFRGLVTAVALTYAISFPFFLFFPVPERWAFPDSGAILLSDLWSTNLIEAIRPISALDNSFPSFHTSLSVVISGTAFAYRLPLWRMTAFLSTTIVLATIALGIHWLPDLIAGFALGILTVALAIRFEDRLETRPSGQSNP